jgi:hypothetical protein
MPDFINPSDGGFATQLVNASSKAPQYAGLLNLSQSQIDGLKHDADYTVWCVGVKTYIHTRGLEATGFTHHLRSPETGKHGQPLGTPPTTFAFAAPPPAVLPDVEGRFRAFAKYCKAQPSYTDAIGLDLGIVASGSAVPLLATVKPVLKLAVEAGAVAVHFAKGKMEGIEVYRDNGTGGFVFIGVGTSGGAFIDHTPLPPNNAPQVWTYKAIFRYKGVQVGLMSNEVKITAMSVV